MGSKVGIDIHRRRSVIVVMDGHGKTLSTTRIDKDPLALAAGSVTSRSPITAAGNTARLNHYPSPMLANPRNQLERHRVVTATSGCRRLTTVSRAITPLCRSRWPRIADASSPIDSPAASTVDSSMRRVLGLMLAVIAAAVVVVSLVGCGSSSKGTATSPTAGSAGVPSTGTGGATASTGPSATSAGGASISIKNFSFSPVPLDVKVGETITITNNDSTDHTFTDDGGAFDTGHIAPAASKTVTITKAGTYDYHCNIHPSMKGVIEVSG
jgi:plastocyanin